MTTTNFPKTIDRLLFIVYNIIKIKEREIHTMTNINTLVIIGAYLSKRTRKDGTTAYMSHMKEYLCENNAEAIEYTKQKLMASYPDCYIGVKQASQSINHQKDKVMQADGTQKVIYLYSNWLFSYDEAEAMQYKEERAKERAEETKRNKLLKQITEYYKTFSTEDLELFVAMHKGM